MPVKRVTNWMGVAAVPASVGAMDAAWTACLSAIKRKGWNSWPDITNGEFQSKMQELPQGTAVAVMTHACDLFSWYAGSLEAEACFCPERRGMAPEAALSVLRIRMARNGPVVPVTIMDCSGCTVSPPEGANARWGASWDP